MTSNQPTAARALFEAVGLWLAERERKGYAVRDDHEPAVIKAFKEYSEPSPQTGSGSGSGTPRVDAELAANVYGRTRSPQYVPADFARTLERELEEATRRYERLRGAVNGTVAADLEYTDAVAKENKRLTAALAATKQALEGAEATIAALRQPLHGSIEGLDLEEAARHLSAKTPE